MSDKILHKRSLTSGVVPSTSSLELGELAINVADGKIHLRRSGSGNNDVVSVVTANTITTGSITATSFTGSLFGTSSWAKQALTASYITGSIFNSNNLVLSSSYAITASYVLTSNTFATSIGNGVSTNIGVTHNLGTRDLIIQLYDNITYETVLCDIIRTNVNFVTCSFVTAPSSDQYRVVIKA